MTKELFEGRKKHPKTCDHIAQRGGVGALVADPK